MWEVIFKSLLSILQLATNLVVFKKPFLQKGTLDNEKSPSRKNKSNTNVFVFCCNLPQKGVLPINKSQIEGKARSIIETFIVEGTCELPPPLLKVKIIALHFIVGDKYCHGLKTIGKTKRHYGVFNESGNKWHFRQHDSFNIWLMVFLSTNEYSTTFVFFLYHLL
jgi:hypothetical protein